MRVGSKRSRALQATNASTDAGPVKVVGVPSNNALKLTAPLGGLAWHGELGLGRLARRLHAAAHRRRSLTPCSADVTSLLEGRRRWA